MMTPRQFFPLMLVTIGLAASTAAFIPLWQAVVGPTFADADDPPLVVRGDRIYAAECAGCHGAHLEGQSNWQVADARGHVRAPPHDGTGHSWEHSDEDLFRLTKNSVYDTAPEGYVSDMPAFASRLSDAEIWAVLAFIKSTWPAGVRAAQATRNPGLRGLASLSGDWSFPPDCLPKDAVNP